MAGIGGNGSGAAIELRNVTKEFTLESGERVDALRGISLTVPKGEFVCVLGPSGHGKSTMLNLIAGFIAPTSGEVVTEGAPVTGAGPDRGVLFQRDTVFLWRRVADNVAFGLESRGMPKAERDEIVARYLELTGLTRFAKAWPKQLSGGMRRRVAIATVFANEPGILLMDEPFVGLDYWRRAALHDVLMELWERSRCTVLFITHDVDEALALGDRIVVIVNGNITLSREVHLPRPRGAHQLASEPANELRETILEQLETTSLGIAQ
jgi:NitT/TauT family transport system ATP-binding protein